MTKRVKYTAVWKNEKLILFFVLLFRWKIKIGFQRLHFFVCNFSTIISDKSCRNRAKSSYDISWSISVHFRIVTKFTGIFRVKGGRRFKATTFCFLIVVVFSVALLGVNFNTILRSHFLLLLLLILPLLILNIQWTLIAPAGRNPEEAP